METVNGNSGAGSLRVLITNNALAHTPEAIAALSMLQLVDKDSNPVGAAEVRQRLVDLYAAAQRLARTTYKYAENDTMIRAINQIVVKDLATTLDVERQIHRR